MWGWEDTEGRDARQGGQGVGVLCRCEHCQCPGDMQVPWHAKVGMRALEFYGHNNFC